MKKTFPFLLLLLCISCDELETRKISSEEILSEEKKELNWREVDQYPAFKECRRISEIDAAKECFGKKVANYIYARLEAKQPVVTEALHDTLLLHLHISEAGVPEIDSVEIDSVVIAQLPHIQSWLRQSIDSLPKIYPATKRGIPVATKFLMPIVIKAE